MSYFIRWQTKDLLALEVLTGLRITLLAACAFLLFCTALPAQISANFRNSDLRSVLRQLESEYPVSFSFDDSALKGIKITARFKNLPLDQAMQRLFEGTGLSFEIIDNQYVLVKKQDEDLTVKKRNDESTKPGLDENTKARNDEKTNSSTLCGNVFDAESGEPLIGATAYVKNSPHGTTTGERGDFSLTGNFKPGDTLEISYLGYERQAALVQDLLGKPCASFRLQFSPSVMPEFTVRDFAVHMLNPGEDGSFQFKPDKIATLPGWGEPDVLRLLQFLPGVASLDESASRLYVRGGTPDQNLIQLDGIPIYHTGHFFGLYDAFNPFIVSEVDTWRGNFGAEYGGRNSSVIDISGKSELSDRTQGGVGLNLLSVQGYLLFPVKKNRSSLLVAGRRSYTDLIQSKTYQNLFNQLFQNGKVVLEQQTGESDRHYSWKPDFSYGDFNLKFTWHGSPLKRGRQRHRESSIGIYYGEDHLDYRFAYDDSMYFAATNDLISARNMGISWQHRAQWSPVFSAKYKVALSDYANDYAFLWNDDRTLPFKYRYDRNNTLTELAMQFHHDWQVSDRHRMSFGYQFSGQEARLIYRDTSAETGEFNLYANDTTRSGLHTFYGEFRYLVSERFSFMLGIRENHFPERGLYFSEPRVSFEWKPFDKSRRQRRSGRRPEQAEPTTSAGFQTLPTFAPNSNFTVRGGMGRYWQFVFQILDYGDLGVGEPLWAVTSADIPAQELWNWSLGFTWQKKGWLVDGEFYRKDSRNLTSVNLDLNRGVENPWTFEGKSAATGFDLLVRKRWGSYSLWAAFSSGKVTQTFPDLNQSLPYPARHDVPGRWNVVHMFSKKRWNVSLNFHTRRGSPYSEPEVIQVPCDYCSADSLTFALSYPRLHTKRLPDVARLDFSAAYKFETRRTKGKIGFSVLNLTNRKNLLDIDYLLTNNASDLPQNEFTLQPIERRAAGATPNLFVQMEW